MNPFSTSSLVAFSETPNVALRDLFMSSATVPFVSQYLVSPMRWLWTVVIIARSVSFAKFFSHVYFAVVFSSSE